MSVVQLEKKIISESNVSNDFILYSEAIDKKVAKDIAKDLTKGYIKLLTNFVN